MKKPLRVGASPITGAIYAGHLLKCGTVWAANKQDVTIDALVATAQHAQQLGKPIEIRANGKLRWRITVETFKDTP